MKTAEKEAVLDALYEARAQAVKDNDALATHVLDVQIEQAETELVGAIAGGLL